MAQGEDWAHHGRGCPADVTKSKESPHSSSSPWLWMNGSPGTAGEVSDIVPWSSAFPFCLQPPLEIGYWVGQTFGLTQLAWSPAE